MQFYRNRHDLFAFKAEFDRFASDVVLDLIPYSETQAHEVVQALDGCTQRIVAITSGYACRNSEGLQGKIKHISK